MLSRSSSLMRVRLAHTTSRASAPVLSAVQQTSLLTAFWRDLEARSASPLCHDTQAGAILAALLSPSTRAAFEASPLLDVGREILAVRTRVIDDWLERPMWPPLRTTKRQVVLLGAGMDSRAYRLGLGPSTTTVFEVDSDAAVLEAKYRVCHEAGHRSRVPVVSCAADLRDARSCRTALLDAGLDPRVPTRWVLEGLLEYLPAERHVELFTMASTTAGAPGSSIVAQALQPSFAAHVAALGASELPYEPLVAVEETLAALRGAGWRSPRAECGRELAARFGRDVHPGFSLVFAEAADEAERERAWTRDVLGALRS